MNLLWNRAWRLPFGANVVQDGVEFRVWAPAAGQVEVELLGAGRPRYVALDAETNGWFAGVTVYAGGGTRYRFRLDGKVAYPDPCSRAQPEGVHGPSMIVDPSQYVWGDDGWRGLSRDNLVIYELHVGTCTPAGTFDALIGELPALKRLGITAIEIMPVAEFPGRWNWGYDGVDLYAPSWKYGGPDALRRLVDAAHQEGLGVLLDVVYNHLGPDGNYLRAFSPSYFTSRYKTPWGEALNFDGPHCKPVREFVVANACYWLVEYHLDGLRLDATHTIFDSSPQHILAELAERARMAVGPDRRVVIIAEHEQTDPRLVVPATSDGLNLDAVWSDDFHHAVHTLLTGEHDGYYRRYPGTGDDIVQAILQGSLPERRPGSDRPTGESSPTSNADVAAIPASAFVFCIQNHDQVGNRAFGERLNHLVPREHYRIASALLLLAPETPLIFMGQEFAASSPFLYFTDHHPELGRQVTAGRRREFAEFDAFNDPTRLAQIPDPQATSTFERSKLNLEERVAHADVLQLYRELLELRRTDPVLAAQDRHAIVGVALTAHLIAFWRWHGDQHRLLLFNLGAAVDVPWATTPFLASLPHTSWRTIWHVGDEPCIGEQLRVPAFAAALLAPTV